MLTTVVSVGCAGVKAEGAHTFLCYLPLLMLLVPPLSPIRGTNKSPTTTKRFLHGAYIKTKRKGATAHNLTRLL